MLLVSESIGFEGDDLGLVNVLWWVLVKDFGFYQVVISDMYLIDFCVCIIGVGVEVMMCVNIESVDYQGCCWFIVGVLFNIVDVSFEVLVEVICWKLICDGIGVV